MTEPSQIPPTQNQAKEAGLGEDAKEFLGMGKDDGWYYPGLLFLIAGCYKQSPPIVYGLFFLSCVFVGIFLFKSFPRYLRGDNLATLTRLYCLCGNGLVIMIQIVAIAAKTYLLLRRAG